jgi:RHS repeat-associated protein
MVLDENGGVKEALMYQPYGTVSDIQGITAPGNDPLRQKFTTKEFDEEGNANGAPGIKAYHFGFRVYDPEIGVWMSTDPADQYWNTYSYCGGDPTNIIDPDGLQGWEAIPMYLEFMNLYGGAYYSAELLELTGEMSILYQQLEALERIGGAVNDFLNFTNEIIGTAGMYTFLYTFTAQAQLVSLLSSGGGSGQAPPNVPASDNSTNPQIPSNWDKDPKWVGEESAAANQLIDQEFGNTNNPNNLNNNANPASKNATIPRSIKDELVKIKAGNGTPRIDPKTGSQTIHTGSKSTQYWKGAKEWDVPGTKHRILEAKSGKFGYVIEHNYHRIKPF